MSTLAICSNAAGRLTSPLIACSGCQGVLLVLLLLAKFQNRCHFSMAASNSGTLWVLSKANLRRFSPRFLYADASSASCLIASLKSFWAATNSFFF